MKIDDELIVKFRKKVDESNFVYEAYKNRNNKDLWSLICSCMDWISVAIRFLAKRPRFHNDIDVRVMQFFSYISAIDIVFESINQLHRAVLGNSQLPFTGKSDIFKNKVHSLDDNDYFKEIRAIFGAHPVNLKDKDKNRRWYASWPYDSNSADKSFLEVRLYSNQVAENDLTFCVDINELRAFLIERYGYLDVLIKELNKQYEDFRESYINKEIIASGTPIEILKALKSESQERLNNDYYSNTIDGLMRIFSATVKDHNLTEEEQRYKKDLLAVIDEIKENLQRMSFVDLANDKILNPDYPYDTLGYAISKLWSCQFRSSDPLFSYYMKVLNAYSDSRYNFCDTDDPDLVFLKLKMMLYSNKERAAKQDSAIDMKSQDT